MAIFNVYLILALAIKNSYSSISQILAKQNLKFMNK